MLRRLVFNPEDNKKFVRIVNMFIIGGNTIYFDPNRGSISRPRAEKSKEAQFIRAYKKISIIVDDNGSRKLQDNGGELLLNQPVYDLLVKYLDAAPSGTQDNDEVDELLDWVDAAEKIKED